MKIKNKKCEVAEIFYSITGEIDSKPAIFIRFSGCNLIRDKKGCEFCDSLYAEEGKEMSIEEIEEELKKYNCKNVVITGGESLVQKDGVDKLIDYLCDDGYSVDMETNGTIFNRNSLWFLDNINCSPKKQSINIEVLKQMMEYNIRFKFVYEDKDDLWFEKIIEELKIDKKQIWIMPIGKTKEEQEEKMKEVIEYCKEKGFNFCPRVHILVYGDKRGT